MESDIFEKFYRERKLLLNTYRNAQMNEDLKVAEYSLEELYKCCFEYYTGLGQVVSNLQKLKKSFPTEAKDMENKIYSITRHRSDLAKTMNEWAFELADMEWRK